MAGVTAGVTGVAERLAEVRRRIASAGGDPSAVRVVAVTKGFGVDAVRAALAAGIRDVGENYAQELVAKAGALAAGEAAGPRVLAGGRASPAGPAAGSAGPRVLAGGRASPAGPAAGSAGPRMLAGGRASPAGLRWHHLGTVQRNKVAALAPHVALWQGVDRLAAGEEIARRAPGGHVLVQVNVDGGAARNGCAVDEVPSLVAALQRLDLVVDGLMAVASPRAEAARRQFVELARLRAGLGLAELSIGMSDDLEAAVEAGSTMVRIGRALFGARPEPPEMRR